MWLPAFVQVVTERAVAASFANFVAIPWPLTKQWQNFVKIVVQN